MQCNMLLGGYEELQRGGRGEPRGLGLKDVWQKYKVEISGVEQGLEAQIKLSISLC